MKDIFVAFVQRAMVRWRQYRSKKLKSLAKLFVKARIPANAMTAIAFLFGIASVLFLFRNYGLFILFAVLHLLADALDGVIARATKPSGLGKYLDYFGDQLVGLLLLIRIALELQDYYVWLILGLAIAAQAVYVLSIFTAPVLFSRSVVFLFLAVQLPTLAYLSAGIVALYSLAVQLRWFVEVRSMQKR